MILPLLLATMAQAVPTTPPAPPPARPMRGLGLRAADADGDGIVTRQEATAQTDAMFTRLDTNRDGKLDAGELDAARPPRGRRGGGGDRPPPAPGQ